MCSEQSSNKFKARRSRVGRTPIIDMHRVKVLFARDFSQYTENSACHEQPYKNFRKVQKPALVIVCRLITIFLLYHVTLAWAGSLM